MYKIMYADLTNYIYLKLNSITLYTERLCVKLYPDIHTLEVGGTFLNITVDILNIV